MWESIVERSKAYPELAFLHELFEMQSRVSERFEELMMGERHPLETGVLMASLAYLTKTYREIYPIIERSGPAKLKEALAQIRRATQDDMLELLTLYYLDDRIPQAALQHLPDAAVCRWFARMFVQPAAPKMLERTTGELPDFGRAPFRCPRCRHLPQYATDLSTLTCSMCLFGWKAPANLCPMCRSDQWRSVELPTRIANVELLVCPDCKAYLKRIQADVPYVEELASTDLDDRAAAQGWNKIEPNLLVRESALGGG
jgi:formate dehydrogenase maturation protein FdhE